MLYRIKFRLCVGQVSEKLVFSLRNQEIVSLGCYFKPPMTPSESLYFRLTVVDGGTLLSLLEETVLLNGNKCAQKTLVLRPGDVLNFPTHSIEIQTCPSLADRNGEITKFLDIRGMERVSTGMPMAPIKQFPSVLDLSVVRESLSPQEVEPIPEVELVEDVARIPEAAPVQERFSFPKSSLKDEPPKKPVGEKSSPWKLLAAAAFAAVAVMSSAYFLFRGPKQEITVQMPMVTEAPVRLPASYSAPVAVTMAAAVPVTTATAAPAPGAPASVPTVLPVRVAAPLLAVPAASQAKEKPRHNKEELFMAIQSNDLEKVKTLAKAGMSMDITLDAKGRPPLIQAAAHGHITIIRYFLSEKKADIDTKDIDGNTALMWALMSSQKNTAKFLIESGANVGLRRDDGATAMVLARELRSKELRTLIAKAAKRAAK